MRGTLRLLPLVFAACASPASAAVAVQAVEGKVDVTATAAPLAEVLDHLARQTGMKIVYEGPAPRQLVTLSLSDRSPAEAVAAILEGQGLNYALILDVTATKVDKLLVTGQSPTGFTSRRAPPPPPRRALVRPPILDEEDQEDADLEDDDAGAIPAAPVPPEGLPAIPGQPRARPTPPPATAPPTAPAGVPLIPNPGYSSSPFNPKPVPLVPAPQPTPTPTPPP
jgi:hypothetical protein